jgi:ferredoxin
MGQWKMTVDRSICIGTGLCAACAPEVTAVGDDGKAYVLDAPSDDIEARRVAVVICPLGALELSEDG